MITGFIGQYPVLGRVSLFHHLGMSASFSLLFSLSLFLSLSLCYNSRFQIGYEEILFRSARISLHSLFETDIYY